MTTPLDRYHQLIDDLTGVPAQSVIANRIQGWGTPAVAHLTIPADVRELMEQFSPAHRDAVAMLVQEAHEAGVFNTLAYLHDRIMIDGLRLVVDDDPLPVEPYGLSLYEEWVGRRAGDAWPSAPEDTP